LRAVPVAIETLAELLTVTVAELGRRAPAIIAGAAEQMNGATLGLHFGDGSHAALWPVRSSLRCASESPEPPDVEAYFDAESLNLLFDLEMLATDEVLEESLDVRGDRAAVLAVWRAFKLLAQRASGLRSVQAAWRSFRDNDPERWGRSNGSLPVIADGSESGWQALDYLNARAPHAGGERQPIVGAHHAREARSLWDGSRTVPWWNGDVTLDSDLVATLEACKRLVREELERMVPERDPGPELYDLMRDYPAREGKGLRPTLTIATCAAFGGRPLDAVRTATAIEFFHNGFLVHDDISDESTHRRGLPTLHYAHGIGLAVNTGDAMNLLAIDAVLSNLQTLGLARTLGLINEVMHMCRETLEGQAIELGWIRNNVVPPRDEDYFEMSTKKTGWYTCMSPCRLGAICAGETEPRKIDAFNEPFRNIGIAFQIQDDALNLIGDEVLYGKEQLGDLLEGKRTVMLIHLFRCASATERRTLEEFVALPRAQKQLADAQTVLGIMHKRGSVEYALTVAERFAHAGVRSFEEQLRDVPETEAKGVLRQIAHYVTTRDL
jgi:geranylgeranyl diphosphate synthase, type II